MAKTDKQKGKATEAPAKKEKKGDKKPNLFVRMGRKIKEVFSELKKVTWPSFGTIVKSTGVVIVVVLIFIIAVKAVDSGLLALLKLIDPAA